MKEDITITMPGRICLFGDHQDYLGLPVIACAIDRKLTLRATENNEDYFFLSFPDISEERKILLSEEFSELATDDLFGSAIKVLRRNGLKINRGYHITITSTIPINAGISSSSALIMAWIQFLLTAFGDGLKMTPEKIAQLAYEAEVLELHSPGGNMDQITIAIGGIVFIETDKELSYTELNTDLDVLIIGESGIPKNTSGMLSSIRTKTQESFEIIRMRDSTFDPFKTTSEEISDYLEFLPGKLKPYFNAAINNHLITQQAKEEFDKTHTDPEILGSLMNEHHNILKNDLGITVPRIDAMIDGALKARSLGAKIVGSGGGGCMVALANHQHKEAIIKLLIESGAKDAYEVSISNGVNFDHYA